MKNNKIIKIEKTKMSKKNKIILIVLLSILTILGTILYKQSKPTYEGYWCTYKEKATIVIMLKNGYSQENKEAIEEKISKYEDVQATSFFSKDEYATEIGANPDEIDLYDTIVVSFTSMNAIGTYIEELSKFEGVLKAEQSYAKNDVELYHIKKWNKYTYANSDETLKEDLIEGKYKEKKGIITFKPNDNKESSKVLYIKDNHLCADAACKSVYFESDETCSSLKND